MSWPEASSKDKDFHESIKSQDDCKHLCNMDDNCVAIGKNFPTYDTHYCILFYGYCNGTVGSVNDVTFFMRKNHQCNLERY